MRLGGQIGCDFAMSDLKYHCLAENQLVYVPWLNLIPNDNVLLSLANAYHVDTVISLYSIHTDFMMRDFVASNDVIEKIFKTSTHRRGVRIITDAEQTCSLLLVLTKIGDYCG